MNLLTPLAVKIGSIPWLPRFLPQITAIDKLIQRFSRGRLSLLRIAGLPDLLLTLVGRRSGRRLTTPLLCVPWHGGNLIAGSNFGGYKPPVWILNLRAEIEQGKPVLVTRRGVREQVRPRELGGAERDRAWAHMVEAWPNYAKYAERTDRLIPVFFLEPVV